MTYELHPLCVLFPRLVGAEFDALCADIRAYGLRTPIVLHDGMVLDGGNRLRACEAIGIEPAFVEFAGGNIVSFVLSANLHRRHMSTSQQAAIVASARNWADVARHGGDRKSDQVLHGALETAKARSGQSGASVSTQRRADAVAKANPDLAVRVGHGEVSLPKAVAQVAPQLGSKKAVKPEVEDVAYSGPSDAEIAAAQADEDVEQHAFRVAAESDDRLGALVAEVTRLKAEVVALRASRDGFMNRSNELIDRVKSLKRQLAKMQVAA